MSRGCEGRGWPRLRFSELRPFGVWQCMALIWGVLQSLGCDRLWCLSKTTWWSHCWSGYLITIDHMLIFCQNCPMKSTGLLAPSTARYAHWVLSSMLHTFKIFQGGTRIPEKDHLSLELSQTSNRNNDRNISRSGQHDDIMQNDQRIVGYCRILMDLSSISWDVKLSFASSGAVVHRNHPGRGSAKAARWHPLLIGVETDFLCSWICKLYCTSCWGAIGQACFQG